MKAKNVYSTRINAKTKSFSQAYYEMDFFKVRKEPELIKEEKYYSRMLSNKQVEKQRLKLMDFNISRTLLL